MVLLIARVVTNQLQNGKMDAWVALIRNAVVPSLEQQAGFRGFVVLTSPESGKSMGMSLRDGAEQLAASESNGNFQQQIAKLAAVLAMPPTREIFEFTVIAKAGERSLT